jgi:hypothetical protein
MALTGGVSNSDLVDLQRTTLPNLPDLEFEVALQNQKYIAVNRWFAKDKKEVEGGTSIVRNVMLDNSGNAQHVRLWQKQTVNVQDVQSRIAMPWVQCDVPYSIERHEALRNRGGAMYIKLLTSRRIDAMLSLANLLELRAFLAPESSTDDVNPAGLPFWLNKVVPSTASGYSSTIDVPGSFCGRRIIYGQTSTPTYVLTNKAGINPTAKPLWRNWADVYTQIDANFVKLCRKAFHAINFESPITITDMSDGPKSNYRIYMNLLTITNYEDIATKQNDNLGPDADKFHGATTFKRVPIEYANQLDMDSPSVNPSWGTDPVYMVNHAKFKPFVEGGNWMYEHDPMSDVELHNVITTWIDNSYQFFCTNVREGGAVIHKACPA